MTDSSRKRSRIWTHFNAISSSKAECNLCKVKISYRAGSTNNLHRHMRTLHPTVQVEESRQAREPANEGASVSTATVAAMSTASSSTPPQPPRPTQSSMSQFLQKAMTPARQNTIDEELAKMVARDFQPFSIVDDKGFRSYTHMLSIQCMQFQAEKHFPKKNHPRPI